MDTKPTTHARHDSGYYDETSQQDGEVSNNAPLHDNFFASMVPSGHVPHSPVPGLREEALDHASDTASHTSNQATYDAFWNNQWMTERKMWALRMATTAVLIGGPSSNLPGVRVDLNPTSKRNIPNATLSVASGDKYKPFKKVSLQAKHFYNKAGWEAWDEAKIHEDIERTWPNSMPSAEVYSEEEAYLSYKRQPGHFVGDWRFFEGAQVTLIELTIDSSSYPSVVFRRHSHTHVDQWLKLQQIHDGDVRVSDEIQGRIWKICPSGEVMPWHIFAFALSQVTLGHDDVAECAAIFPKRYVCPSPTVTWTNWSIVSAAMLHAQFHTRYLSTEENAITSDTGGPTCSGLSFERDYGQAASFDPASEFSIVETRSSAAILASLSRRFYTIVVLMDTDGLNLDCVAAQSHWVALGLQFCSQLSGLSIWQAVIGSIISEWGYRWTRVLDLLMVKGKVTVKEALGLAKQHPKPGSLQPGVRYALRELLSISEAMILELSRDLHSLSHDLTHSASVVSPAVEQNWAALYAHHKKIEVTLLDRIRGKLAELATVDNASNDVPRALERDSRAVIQDPIEVSAAVTVAFAYGALLTVGVAFFAAALCFACIVSLIIIFALTS